MNRSILYRWDNPEAGTPDPPRQSEADVLKKKIDELLPRFKENIKVAPVKIPIRSTRDKEITNRSYLSSSMGVGGHIIGFLKYQKGQEEIDPVGYTTFHGSQQAFRSPGRRLFVIPGSSIVNVQASLYSVSDADLDNTIRTCDGIIKVSQLGSLMPAPSTNTAEVNFVGNGVSFDAFMISFGDEGHNVLKLDSKKARPESDDDDSDDEPPKLPPLTGFIRKGGQPGKTVRSDAGVPENFSIVLDYLWDTDRVPDIVLPIITSEDCPGAAGAGKRKRKTYKRSRRAFRGNSKKSQKRRLSSK